LSVTAIKKRKQRKATKPKAAVKAVEPLPFPNIFMDRILEIQMNSPGTFNLFSPSLRASAAIYEEQRDRWRARAVAAVA
jgi:hypothetical protein